MHFHFFLLQINQSFNPQIGKEKKYKIQRQTLSIQLQLKTLNRKRKSMNDNDENQRRRRQSQENLPSSEGNRGEHSQQVQQLMRRVASMHDHFQNASRIQSALQELNNNQQTDSSAQGRGSASAVAGNEGPRVDTQRQIFDSMNDLPQLSSVREEGRPVERDNVPNTSIPNGQYLQTQRMNYQDQQQDNRQAFDINLLRQLQEEPNAPESAPNPEQRPRNEAFASTSSQNRNMAGDFQANAHAATTRLNSSDLQSAAGMPGAANERIQRARDRNSQTQQNLQHYLTRLRNIRDRTANASTQNSIGGEQPIEPRPTGEGEQLVAQNGQGQSVARMQPQAHQNIVIPPPQSQQQQQPVLNNLSEDNIYRGTGRIIQNLLNNNQNIANQSESDRIQNLAQMNNHQQQEQQIGTSTRNQSASNIVNSQSTNFTTLTSQATRNQNNEYNQLHSQATGRAAENANGLAAESVGQQDGSQVNQQTISAEEGRSGSTHRERFNSTNQQQNWPPVELYQQIDALIQQSSLQQQQAALESHSAQPVAAQSQAADSGSQTQVNQGSSQAQILRSILRQSNLNQPASSSNNAAAQSNQEDLRLGPQHSSLDDSMSMQITQQQILDSITSNSQLRNQHDSHQESNHRPAGYSRVGGNQGRLHSNLTASNIDPEEQQIGGIRESIARRQINESNRWQRAMGQGRRNNLNQAEAAATERLGGENANLMSNAGEDEANDNNDGIDNSHSTMNEEQMNEIINGSRANLRDDSSSANSDDVGLRLGMGAASRATDARPTGTGASNNDRQLMIDPSGNRNNIQISNVQEQLRQRQQEILGREPRWASGAGPLESDDEFEDDLQSNLVSSAARANANRIDADSSSNPSPPLASYNHHTSQQNRNPRHVLGGAARSAANNFGRASSSDDDSNEEEESNNTSHEENLIASDANFRRQQESNLNLRALGIRNTSSNQIINLQEQNRQNVFNRIITSHMQREQIESGNANQRNRAENNENRAATGANGYPVLDDLDMNDNDDVVSMNDSLNMLVINNTNINGNGRRQPQDSAGSSVQISSRWNQSNNNAAGGSGAAEQQINSNSNANGIGSRDSMLRSSAIRHMREEAKNNANQNIEEIFKCFICFGKIQDAVLCPSCSKLCCRDCIRKWLTEQRQQCPHCRCHLQVSQLINCRFVEEITAAIDTLNKSPPESSRNGTLPDGNLLRNGQEICKEHGARLDYYCQTCKIPICSECAMFGGNAHKDHKFLRLSEVYEKHCEVIRNEAIGLKKRLKELTKYTNDVETTIEKVTKAKEEKSKEIENFNENIQHKLNTKLKNKLLTLWAQRQSMQDEIEQLEEFHQKLNLELTKMPKTSLIKKSGDLIRQLKEIHTKEPHKFIDNEVSIDFSSDIVPEYEQSIFVIKNFSRIRQSQSNQIQDDNEIVYSDPPLVTKSGLTWRLKVYPNGNGIAKGNYISVFLEMLKGLPEQQTQKYEYRVEMINHRTPSAQVVREFASEFEVGECWGYNRFYRIDLLDREGYLNTVDDSITLKFFVRAPCYSQHCQDQERHITNLQKQLEMQQKEMEQMREKLNQAQKSLKKRSSKAAKKLRAVNPNNGQIPEESNEENEVSQDDDNSNETEDKQKNGTQPLEFLDSQKQLEYKNLQNPKSQTHHYLKDLKDKQKKNDLRLQQNQQQISSIIGNKKAQNGSKVSSYPDMVSNSGNGKNANPFNEEGKVAEEDQQVQQSPRTQQAARNPTRSNNNQDVAAASSLAAACALEEKPRYQQVKKEDLIKLDFYSKGSNLGKSSSQQRYEEDKQNESHDSNGSNKLLMQFKQDMSHKKKYAKHNYVSEDNYDKIMADYKKHSDSSSQKQHRNNKNTMNNSDEDKREVMSNGHAPFKSEDESNQSDQPSMNSSSQNDEEKREKQQYKVLKESLRQLQHRANTTLANQQKLMMGAMSDTAKEPGNPSTVLADNYAQNYSVSSGQEDDQGEHMNNIMQDSNYDDQGLSASGSDNQSSADGQEPPYNAGKYNIFGSPDGSTGAKQLQPSTTGLNNKKKFLMNNEEDDDDDVVLNEEDGPVMTMSSPDNAASRAGVNGESAVEQSYIQSSMDNFEIHSSQEEEGLGDTDVKREFKVRDPEDLGASLPPQHQQTSQLNQSKSEDQKHGTVLNDSIEHMHPQQFHKKNIEDQQKQLSTQQQQNLKIQQLRKLTHNQEIKSLQQQQISAKFNFEQIQSTSSAGQAASDSLHHQSKFEEAKSSQNSSRPKAGEAAQQLLGSHKLSSINEKVQEKKKLSSQFSVKGLQSQMLHGHQQPSSMHSSTQLNFKKLASSNSSQLKIGNIQHSQGQSQSHLSSNNKSQTQTNLSGMANNASAGSSTQQLSQQQQAAANESSQSQSSSANQKLLAGLNQLKQKRMLKQTMTLPNQQLSQQQQQQQAPPNAKKD